MISQHLPLLLVFFVVQATATFGQDIPKPAEPTPVAPGAPAVVPATVPTVVPTVVPLPPQTVTGNTIAIIPPMMPAPEDPVISEARKEIARLMADRDRLMMENAITKEKLAKELSDRRGELERQTLRMEEEKMKLTRDTEAARLQAERENSKLKAENELLALTTSLVKNKAEIRMTELRLAESEARTAIAKMAVEIEQKDKELSSAQYAAGAKPIYLDNPHVDNKLIISDRRIALNGPIVSRTADEISDRIDFYNNKNATMPIFIVIDNSPGGSVMAGYKILRAMEGSKAPVYVVVKQFAASMAACITTLADKSFAYPNSVILHHQISTVAFGNLTQQKESLAEIEQWWVRMAGPIAKKMGVSLEDFIKQMYQNVSTGDWTEFGDKAQKLKWVDTIVDEIQETGVMKHPDLNPPPPPQPSRFFIPSGQQAQGPPAMTECLDEKGHPFMFLPRANPKDAYYLFNPDGYYRLP